jgi:hypothetical protein
MGKRGKLLIYQVIYSTAPVDEELNYDEPL